MGKRYSKHLRKINKLRDVFVEELITDAGLLVYAGEGNLPPGTSVDYRPFDEGTGATHVLKIQYQPPMYLNVRPGTDVYETMVRGLVTDGVDAISTVLREEGISHSACGDQVLITVA